MWPSGQGVNSCGYHPWGTYGEKLFYGGNISTLLRTYGNMTTIVNITLVQEGDTIRVRSDALGSDEEVLSLSLQLLSHLMMLENINPELVTVDFPTITAHAH